MEIDLEPDEIGFLSLVLDDIVKNTSRSNEKEDIEFAAKLNKKKFIPAWRRTMRKTVNER